MNANQNTSPQISADDHSQEHVKFIQDYYAAWSRRDEEALMACFTEDSVFEERAFEARFEGLEQIRGFVDMTYAGSPDFKVVPTRIVANGKQLAAEWRMSGTHGGDLAGMTATGKTFEMLAVSYVTMENGRIADISDYWNPVTFQRLVGLI